MTAVSADGAPPTGGGWGVVVHRSARRAQPLRGGGDAERVPDRPTSLRAVSALAALQDGVLTTRQVEEAGVSEVLLRTLLRSGAWVVLVRGSYLVEPERSERERRRSWARAGTLLVPGSAASHHTAAALLGIRGAPRAGVVHVSRAAKALVRPQLHPHRATFGPDDVVDLDGLPVTSPRRTLTDLVPGLDRLEAQAVLDSALHTGAVSRSELLRAGEAFVFPRGMVHFLYNMDVAAPALVLSGLNSQSPGAQLVLFSAFRTEPPVPDEVLKKAFKINGQDVHRIQRNLGGSS